MNEENQVVIDPFTGKPTIQKIKKEVTQITTHSGGGGTVNSIVAGNNITVDSSDPTAPIVTSTAVGGVSIGDTIGNSPDSNGLLYADATGLLKNDYINNTTGSYFGGAVTSHGLASSQYANFPRIGWVDATSVGGGPAVGVLTSGLTASYYFMIDTSTLSAKGALNYDPSTPANSFFTIALANGLGGTPEFTTSISNAQFNVPLDMNSNPITEVDDPTNAQDVATKNYVDTEVSGIDIDSILPSQTGNSGEFLTTDGSNASWATVSASPGGSDTQLQYNNAGSFGGMSNVTKSGDGLLLSTVGNESFIAVGPQGYYGTAFAQDEPHVAINTVRLIGNGGNALVLRNGNNINNITLYSDAVAVNSYKTPSNGIIGFYLTENAPNNAATITMASSDQGFFARKARLQVQAESGLISADATINTIQAKAQTSQTGNLFDAVNTSGTRLWGIDQTGAMKPASMADSAAANDTVYYSTDASKLVYKDAGGTVNNLY